uniref:Sorting nexin 6 n=1 Tax=Cebus imitator TaxID=2715852 RepID=A0A2K5RRY6_CEBIM
RAPAPGPRLGAAMMEGLDDGPDFLSEEDRGLKAINVDLQSDAALQVDISDALSERDKVKFTVHTKIPPAPPRPDFDASREKLQKLGEGEGSMTKEEFTKMKQELEAGWITENLGFILLLPPSSASFFFVFTE